MLKKNVHPLERALRIVLGIALIAGFFLMPEAAYRGLFLIGIVPIFTGIVGSCPLYTVFGFSTCPLK